MTTVTKERAGIIDGLNGTTGLVVKSLLKAGLMSTPEGRLRRDICQSRRMLNASIQHYYEMGCRIGVGSYTDVN
jgi:hypothetical protein